MSDDLRVQVIRFNLGKNYENAKKDTVEVEENIFYSTPAVSADTVSADSTNLKPKKGLMITFAKAEDKTENVEKPEYEFIFSDVKKRHELSWGEIGEIALNSGKNFVKGMFCDENGFSLKRTAMTVGTVAALAFAAPVAAAAGASAAVVAGIAGTAKVAGLGLAGYMTFNGGKNIIEGTQKYYDSTTEAEAKASMSQAMDGAVEVATAVPAFGIIKGGAAKGKKMASKKAEAQQNQPAPEGAKPAAEAPKPVEEAPKAEAKPVEESKPIAEAPKAEAKPVEEQKPIEEAPKAEEAKPAEKPAETAPVDYNKVVSSEKEVDPNGLGYTEHQWNAKGKLLKTTTFDNDGKIIREINNKYDSKGNKIEFNFKDADGNENIEIYNNGVVEKIKTKGLFGEDDLTRVGDGIYEGTRTKKDGTQVKIRFNDKTYETTELGPVEASKAGTKPVEEPKPIEEAPKAETKPVEESKPAEKPAETKPAEEAPKAETKPAERKFPEAKDLSDEKIYKEFITALLNGNPKNKDLITAFLKDLKKYNDPSLSAQAIETDLAKSAELLKSGLTIKVQDGKIYMNIDGRDTYSVNLKTAAKAPETPAAGVKPEASKPAAEAAPAPETKPAAKADETKPATETKPVEEAKPAEEAMPVEKTTETKPAAGTAENPISLHDEAGRDVFVAKLKELYSDTLGLSFYKYASCGAMEVLRDCAPMLIDCGLNVNKVGNTLHFCMKDGTVFAYEYTW